MKPEWSLSNGGMSVSRTADRTHPGADLGSRASHVLLTQRAFRTGTPNWKTHTQPSAAVAASSNPDFNAAPPDWSHDSPSWLGLLARSQWMEHACVANPAHSGLFALHCGYALCCIVVVCLSRGIFPWRLNINASAEGSDSRGAWPDWQHTRTQTHTHRRTSACTHANTGWPPHTRRAV